MANKTIEIDFLGLGNNPSDYDCKDGTLALAVNVLHENGSIENAHYSAPEVKHTYNNANHTVIYQHKILEESLSIFIDKDINNNYRYFTTNSGGGATYNALENVSGKIINDINSTGNTLIFYCNDETHYYLWKDNQYKWLGTELPEIEMTFGLDHHIYDYMKETTEGAETYKDGFRIFVPDSDLQEGGVGTDSHSHIFHDKDITNVSEAVFGLVNRFQGDWCAEHGYFSQPFFVRYALRLFDGSYTKHSAPILLMPVTGSNPVIPIVGARSENGATDNYIDINCVGIGSSLNYYLKSKTELEDKWKDIVKGVDVFVSAPIYTYDSTEKVKRFVMPHWGDHGFISPYVMSTMEEYTSNDWCFGRATSNDNNDMYRGVWDTYTRLKRDTDQPVVEGVVSIGVNDSLNNVLEARDSSNNFLASLAWKDNSGTTDIKKLNFYKENFYPIAYVHVPSKNNGKFNEEVRDTGNFYLIKSFETEDLKAGNTRTEIEIEKGVLSALVTRTTLDDDYESHDTLIPNYTRSYNERINLADVTKTYFQGFYPFSLFQRVITGETHSADNIVIRIHLNVNNKKAYVERRGKDIFQYNYIFPYIFYPDPKAYKAEIFTGGKKITFPMREHKFLNGAIAYIGIEAIRNGKIEKWEPCDLNDILDEDPPAPITKYMPNYVYTSEVNNPFKFKAKNVERVGSGKIIAMSPTTLPLSQGQYGYAEMYCFTTDGIWALKVSDTGGWSAKQPFHYDIILNEDRENILQMERDVLFSTTRGLMILAGNSIDCITENFNGRQDVFLSGLAWSQQFGKGWKNTLKEKVFPKIWNGNDALYRDMDYFEDFNKFIGNAVMLYDYTHQRVIIGNPDYSFSFIFSLEDKMWTTIPIKILSAVNSYPNCLANVYDEYNERNLLVDFASTDSPMAQPKNGVIITRPIKLNSPSVQKTIRTINLHGQFDKHNTSMILLGCNDNAMTDWFVVSSCEGSRLPFRYGTPFKYFRLVVVTNLDRNESISGASIEFEYKELNKERQ